MGAWAAGFGCPRIGMELGLLPGPLQHPPRQEQAGSGSGLLPEAPAGLEPVLAGCFLIFFLQKTSACCRLMRACLHRRLFFFFFANEPL